MTHLHETSLMWQFLHVEFNIPICREQSVLQIDEYYFSLQSYEILKTAKMSNLKSHNNEKMAVKEKRTIFQHHLNELSKWPKILEKSSRIM